MTRNANDLFSLLCFVTATARWTQNGVTVAGGQRSGNGRNQLYRPRGLHVDEDGTVIVADWGNHRIVELRRDATNGTVLAGGNGQGNRPDQLDGPTDVIFDKEIGSLIICDRGNRRVTRWPRRSGTRSGETIINDIACHGLTMDDEWHLSGWWKWGRCRSPSAQSTLLRLCGWRTRCLHVRQRESSCDEVREGRERRNCCGGWPG